MIPVFLHGGPLHGLCVVEVDGDFDPTRTYGLAVELNIPVVAAGEGIHVNQWAIYEYLADQDAHFRETTWSPPVDTLVVLALAPGVAE